MHGLSGLISFKFVLQWVTTNDCAKQARRGYNGTWVSDPVRGLCLFVDSDLGVGVFVGRAVHYFSKRFTRNLLQVKDGGTDVKITTAFPCA